MLRSRWANAIMLVALLPLSLSAMASREVGAQSSCLASKDTAASIREDIMTHLTSGDSGRIVTVGLPYKPRTVKLVTSGTLCEKLIAAFNTRLSAADSLRARAGYVFKLDEKAYALVPDIWPSTVDYYLANDLAFAGTVAR